LSAAQLINNPFFLTKQVTEKIERESRERKYREEKKRERERDGGAVQL